MLLRLLALCMGRQNLSMNDQSSEMQYTTYRTKFLNFQFAFNILNSI